MKQVRLLVMAPVIFFACASNPQEPDRFLQKSFEAKKDSARHLKALDELCRIETTSSPTGASSGAASPNFQFCVEALKLRAATGEKSGLAERAESYCQKGDPESCLLWVQYSGDAGDLRMARDTLTRSCEQKDPKYCLFAARMEYRIGSPNEALKRAKKGCTAGIAAACQDLGHLALEQDDTNQAALSFQKACQADLTEGCLQKSLVQRIQGKNPKSQLASACTDSKDPLPCALVEIQDEKEKNSEWGPKTEKACKAGSARDCYLAALDQYYRPGGRNLAKFRFSTLCEQPSGEESCFQKLRISNPFGFETSQEPEIRKLCERGARAACFALETRSVEQPTVSSRKVAPENLADSCEREHHTESCEEKAKLSFAAGDAANAKYFMTKACDQGSEDSCAWLANRILAQEKPTDSDRAEARELFVKACLAGSVLGCEKALSTTPSKSTL